MTKDKLRVYGDSRSGNCYKIQLLCAQMGIGYAWQAGREQALAIMEQQLSIHRFFAGDRYSIADIALFAYTHVADEGGFSLHGYPAIHQWIERIQGRPNIVPMANT